MLQQGKHYFEFGSYRLDAAAGVLTRNGERVALNPKAAETLAVLLRSRGEVVSKEDLMKAVWPDAFVEEANLNVQISALRKALEDSADTPAFVETIPRRGYRFCVEVQEVYEEPAEWQIQRRTVTRMVTQEEVLSGEDVVEVAPHPQTKALPGPRRVRGAWMALGVLLLAGSLAAYLRFARPPGAPAPTGRVLLGVLPFTNLSGDAEQEYLADGLTEELITELARVNPAQLGVIARTSMMPYKKTNKGVRAVAQELGLLYVLEGSVVRAGTRLRVTVKLIQAGDQSQLWANEYDRDFSDLIDVRRAIATAVAQETFGRVTPEWRQQIARARAVLPQAYDAYLKGRVYWWMRTEDGYQRARAYFEEARRLDPRFARAYAGLADTSLVYGMRLGDPLPYARRAVEFDDSLAEAHTSLAMSLLAMEIDWAGAEKHFRRALEIDPYYTSAHHWYGFMLMHWGRSAEAIEQLGRARETDPLNIVVLSDLGRALYFARQNDRAREPLRKAISLDPKFQWPHYWLGRIWEDEGEFQQALAAYEKADALPMSPMNKDAALACLAAKMGQPEKARAILRQLERRGDFFPVNRARIYTLLGKRDRAIEIISQMERKWLTYVLFDPGFDSLRSDPRFRAIAARVAPPSR
jgi:TolB-like protein/DNA-binding winged helix-turn-helix (wHTH) protein/Tfp pilus assembly protein PilF